MNYSEKIEKQLDNAGAVIEHWEYRELPSVRFIGLEFFINDDWEEIRKKVTAVLDSISGYESGFNYDLTLSHHFGKGIEKERRHDYIGRFMKIDTPVPNGFVSWDFVPDERNTPYLTFCSQFAFSVFAGDLNALYRHEGFDVNALYDITRNMILEEKITIPYPEIYWTAEVRFDRADSTIYNPEHFFDDENNPNKAHCGYLFSIYSCGKKKSE